MIITEQIEKPKSRTLAQWLEIVTGGIIQAPKEQEKDLGTIECHLCEDTMRTDNGKKCLCYYEKLNEDGHDF